MTKLGNKKQEIAYEGIDPFKLPIIIEMAYKTRLNIKHNYTKATLKSFHEDIIIKHKLGKKKVSCK
jgi:hypothetical protein